MLNPASRSRKPNPLAIFCRRRFSEVLWTRKAPSASTAATNRTWMTMPRTTGSCQGGGRFGRGASGISVAIEPEHRHPRPVPGPRLGGGGGGEPSLQTRHGGDGGVLLHSH